MPKSNYTHIAFVLDRSGSMSSVRTDTIGGFNKFLEDQKAVEGECTFSLCQFDHEYESLYDFSQIGKVSKLTDETFVPRGWTALYDAIARQIIETGKSLKAMTEDKRPEKVIFVILTDGEENKSIEYAGEKGRLAIQDMIKHQTEKYSWEFLFLGANINAELVGGSLGIKLGNSMTFACNADGVDGAFGAVSKGMTTLRSMSKFDYDASVASATYASFSAEDKAYQQSVGANK